MTDALKERLSHPREELMSEWKIVDTGVQSAEENMRFDAELLEKAESFSSPILHLYEWAGESATYGYFTAPAKLLNLDEAKKRSFWNLCDWEVIFSPTIAFLLSVL